MVKKILALYLISFFVFPPLVFAEETEEVSYDIVNIKKGDPAPFDGILLTPAAAAQIAVDKKFEDAECGLRIEYELQLQKRDYELLLSFKDVEIHTWKDKYEAMMILKTSQIDDLRELVLKPKPANGPLAVALGFGIGTLTSLGIFAISTEIANQ
jgi:hypothetical protein